MTHQREIKQKKFYTYFIIVMEPTDERLASLEQRVVELERLLDLLLKLKEYKVDFSKFTCEPLKLGK